jgi:acyl-[acyl carrier protein]--UDP-N-acetylglucosamine O-acyltransferase
MEIKKAFRLVYRDGFNITQAIEESKKMTWGPEAQFFLDFIASAKKRGVSSVAPQRGGATPGALGDED